MTHTKVDAIHNYFKGENRLLLAAKTATIVCATLAFFINDFSLIFSDAIQNETTSYVLIIPIIFLYMLYRKRRILSVVAQTKNENETRKLRYLTTIIGVLVTATSVMIYWHGSYTFTPLEYHLIALPTFIAGITLILFDLKTLRQLAFPIIFLFALTPPPADILYSAGATLQDISSELSRAIVGLVGIPTTLVSEYNNPTFLVTRPDGNMIQFTIDIACSGIYSLIGFFVFAALIAYMIRDKPQKKIALLLTGIPIIFLLNIVRITSIISIGYNFGENLALEVFHLLGGWVLIFFGTILLLIISEKGLKTHIFSPKPKPCNQCNPKQISAQEICLACGRILKAPTTRIKRTDIARIGAIILATIILLSIQTPVFASTENSTLDLEKTSNNQTKILPNIPSYALHFSYRDTDFEEKAQQDLAITYVYIPENKTEKAVWTSIEIASTRSALHRWEDCLISRPLNRGGTPGVTQIDLHDVKLTENPPIFGRYFVFQDKKTNQIQSVLYWYESTAFNVESTLQQKQVKISIIFFPDDLEEVTKTENLLTTFAKSVVTYRQPITTWSPVALALSQTGAYIATATSAILLVIVILVIMEKRKQRELDQNVYAKLSGENKILIDSIKETQQKTIPTLNNIAQNFAERTATNPELGALLQKLQELTKIDAIKSSITNREDEAFQTWKT